MTTSNSDIKHDFYTDQPGLYFLLKPHINLAICWTKCAGSTLYRIASLYSTTERIYNKCCTNTDHASIRPGLPDRYNWVIWTSRNRWMHVPVLIMQLWINNATTLHWNIFLHVFKKVQTADFFAILDFLFRAWNLLFLPKWL